MATTTPSSRLDNEQKLVELAQNIQAESEEVAETTKADFWSFQFFVSFLYERCFTSGSNSNEFPEPT